MRRAEVSKAEAAGELSLIRQRVVLDAADNESKLTVRPPFLAAATSALNLSHSWAVCKLTSSLTLSVFLFSRSALIRNHFAQAHKENYARLQARYKELDAALGEAQVWLLALSCHAAMFPLRCRSVFHSQSITGAT